VAARKARRYSDGHALIARAAEGPVRDASLMDRRLRMARAKPARLVRAMLRLWRTGAERWT
jgi:hypothetical protein